MVAGLLIWVGAGGVSLIVGFSGGLILDGLHGFGFVVWVLIAVGFV